jgi:hypothetical protein
VTVAKHVAPQLIAPPTEATFPIPLPLFVTVRRGLNVAPTVPPPVITRVHTLPPLHRPDQLANAQFVAGVAEKFTDVPCENEVEHAPPPLPQLIPAGDDAMLPPFVGVAVAFTTYESSVNVTVTVRAISIVTLHELVVDVQPLHVPKLYPVAGVAVSVTLEPTPIAAEQIPVGQLMPPTFEVTEPVPAPIDTDSVRVSCTKAAATVVLPVIAIVQLGLVPEQPLVQLLNSHPLAGVAVIATAVPCA